MVERAMNGRVEIIRRQGRVERGRGVLIRCLSRVDVRDLLYVFRWSVAVLRVRSSVERAGSRKIVVRLHLLMHRLLLHV